MATTQRELVVDLPIGYVDQSGQIHRRAKLRKMRGHEEALLYDASLTAAQLVTELLFSCLVQLGEVELKDKSIVANLYTADRNYLLVELRRFTLGNQLRAAYVCPGCHQSITLIEDLSQLPVHRLDQGQPLAELEVCLEDGYVDLEGNHHADLVLTLPKGTDEEFVAQTAAQDPLRAQDALILRCIKRFGDLRQATLESYGIKILRDITLGDRRILQRALADETPGIDFRRAIECGHCGVTFESVLDASVFFSSN